MATTKVASGDDEGGADSQGREAISRSSSARFLSRVQDRCASRCRPVVFATVTCSRKKARWPGIQYPRVPGHEVAGIIDELGAGVSEWKKGQRVGVGWHGGHDGTCLSVPARRFSQLPEPENSGHQL